jgi:hypothetical protein
MENDKTNTVCISNHIYKFIIIIIIIILIYLFISSTNPNIFFGGDNSNILKTTTDLMTRIGKVYT